MSIEVSNLRVTKLRAYLMNIITELIGQYGEMNINFLSNEPNNYSLDKIPVNPTTEQWIIGNFLKRDVYSFRSRMNYSADTMTNIENIGFYETFEKIIKQKDDNNILPDIEGIQSITCLNCGTLNRANTNTAEFDIQIEIQYRDDNISILPSL